MADRIQSELMQYNQLQKKIEEFYRNYAKICGLSDSVFWIIYSIIERGKPFTQTELCNLWSFNKQTINTSLKNLEADGIIRFEPLEKSKKNKQIFLTDKGSSFAQRTVIPFMDMEKRAFGALDDEERNEFLRLTQKHLDLLHIELDKQLQSSSEDIWP